MHFAETQVSTCKLIIVRYFKYKKNEFGEKSIKPNNIFGELFNGDFFKKQQLFSDADIKAIQAYNTEIDRGTGSQTAFCRTMLDASDEAKNMVAAANGNKIALDGLTRSSKAAELGMKALSMACNMLLSFAASFVISKVAEKIYEVGTAATTAKENSESLISSLSKMQSEYAENSSKIDELSKKIR